jgi:hypothetical protein
MQKIERVGDGSGATDEPATLVAWWAEERTV